MKQGTGVTSMSARKVEPTPHAISVAAVSDLGAHQTRTKSVELYKGRGFNAPGIKSSSSNNGSQGTY